MTKIIGYASPKVMSGLRIICLLCAMGLGLLTSLSAYAEDPQPAVVAAEITSVAHQQALPEVSTRQVIEQQLAAFKARNSAEAYAVISPAFRNKYKSPLRFATMMRLQFWDLYNHSTYRFVGHNPAEPLEIQKVEVTGDDEIPRIYLYRLIRGADGHWLIDDVLMLDPDAQPI